MEYANKDKLKTIKTDINHIPKFKWKKANWVLKKAYKK